MKQAEKENSDSTSYLEATTKEKSTFVCEQCDKIFKSTHALKIHIGKSHKASTPLPPPEQVRDNLQENSLTVSPVKGENREDETETYSDSISDEEEEREYPVGHNVPKGRPPCYYSFGRWQCLSIGTMCQPKC